jgi:hypothetical protein
MSDACPIRRATSSSLGPTATTGSHTTPARVTLTSSSACTEADARCHPGAAPALANAAPRSDTDTRRSRRRTQTRTGSPGRYSRPVSTIDSARTGSTTSRASAGQEG